MIIPLLFRHNTDLIDITEASVIIGHIKIALSAPITANSASPPGSPGIFYDPGAVAFRPDLEILSRIRIIPSYNADLMICFFMLICVLRSRIIIKIIFRCIFRTASVHIVSCIQYSGLHQSAFYDLCRLRAVEIFPGVCYHRRIRKEIYISQLIRRIIPPALIHRPIPIRIIGFSITVRIGDIFLQRRSFPCRQRCCRIIHMPSVHQRMTCHADALTRLGTGSFRLPGEPCQMMLGQIRFYIIFPEKISLRCRQDAECPAGTPDSLIPDRRNIPLFPKIKFLRKERIRTHCRKLRILKHPFLLFT